MKLKVAVAVVAAVMFGACWAQEASGPFAGQVPVNCTLKKALSTRNAKVGEAITAVTEKPTTVNGVAIPRGSVLTGHVVDSTPYKKGGQSASLTVVFDKLEPKKGTAFPIEASVYQIGLSDNQTQGQRHDADMGMRGSAAEMNTTSAVRGGADQMNNTVQGSESAEGAPVHVVSAVPGVALSAAAGGERSAIMTASKQDVELAGGASLVVGVKAK
jgi:hypothetical protein